MHDRREFVRRKESSEAFYNWRMETLPFKDWCPLALRQQHWDLRREGTEILKNYR